MYFIENGQFLALKHKYAGGSSVCSNNKFVLVELTIYNLFILFNDFTSTVEDESSGIKNVCVSFLYYS